jgi:hypothetical protein
MAHINTVQTEAIQAGTALVPPIATTDLWPSLDPTVPFTLQSTGINNFPALTNQIGLYNGIGLQSITGLTNLFGFKTGVGGQSNAEPTQENSCAAITMASPDGKLLGFWTLNGNCFQTVPCSDFVAKKNVIPISNSLQKINNLQGVTFDWNEEVVPELSQNESTQMGLIAQEVEKIVPEVVSNTIVENQQLKSIKYENLVALLIEGMKEQQEQINSLKETVQELSTKLAECCP